MLEDIRKCSMCGAVTPFATCPECGHEKWEVPTMIEAGPSSFGGPENSFVKTDKNILPISQMEPIRTLTISKGTGEKEAVIDFSGDEVTYSGDLLVDESAKLFFDALFQQFKPRCKTCRWYGSEPFEVYVPKMCSCPKMLYGYGYKYNPAEWAKEDDDIITIENDEGWGMTPKPNFGCVHHEEKS